MKGDATIKRNFQKVERGYGVGNPQKLQSPSKNNKEEKVPVELLNVGYYLITPLLLGVGAGVWLDKHLDTRPFFVVGGLAFGMVSSLYLLFKILREK